MLLAFEDSRCSQAIQNLEKSFFKRMAIHIQWENAVLLPLAKKRLTKADLEHLARSLEPTGPDAPAVAYKRNVG